MGTKTPIGRGSVIQVLVPVGLLASSLTLGILALVAKGGGRLIGCSTLSVGLAVFAVNVLPLASVGSLAKEVFTLVGCLGGLALLRIGEVPEHGLAFVRTPFVLGIGFIVVGGWVWFGNRRAARSRPPLVVVSPLPAGTYTVLQGGGARVNHHAAVEEQRHALDLVRTRAVGPRTRRLRPRQLDDYLGYGDPVASPVDGTVVAVEEGHPDGGPTQPECGNCVVIEPDGLPGWRVVLAHLKAGSVRVEIGERVWVGDVLGVIGSSGNSTEPHLHLHVADDRGLGVPMRFGARRPLHRNDRLGASEAAQVTR